MPTEEQQVSEAMVGLYERRFGCRPAAAQTHWCGPDAIACFLEDTLTPPERNLVKLGEHTGVRDRRTVRSFHSSIDTRANGLSTETFLFHPEGEEGGPPDGAVDVAGPELTPAEQAATELAGTLLDTGRLEPLIEAIKKGRSKPRSRP